MEWSIYRGKWKVEKDCRCWWPDEEMIEHRDFSKIRKIDGLSDDEKTKYIRSWLGALKYYILKVDSKKDSFELKESVD